MVGTRPARWGGLLSWFDRLGSLYSGLSGFGVLTVGGLTAWAAWAAQIMSSYAPFSWVVAGLGGASIVTLILAAFAWVRLKWAQAMATEKWKENVTAVNPLETTFRSQRIRLADLVSPITREIRGKAFIDCELLGPMNLGLFATRPGSGALNGVTFSQSDFVACGEGAMALNAIALVDCTVLGGTIHEVTLYIPETHAAELAQQIQGIRWLVPPMTRGPNAGSSPQSPLSTGGRTQP